MNNQKSQSKLQELTGEMDGNTVKSNGNGTTTGEVTKAADLKNPDLESDKCPVGTKWNPVTLQCE